LHSRRGAADDDRSGLDHQHHLDRGAPSGSRIRGVLGDEGGARQLSKSLALELGGQFIRVNCIAPDVIPTPGIGDVPVKTPLPRAGDVDDVAGAAVYLASDLSRFVTGVTLHVDGGNWAAGGWRRGPDGFTT
jgi:hypothetical protein